MKSNSQTREQNAKKKEALNEYLEALKVVDYWANKVRELSGTYWKNQDGNAEPVRKSPGDPTAFTILERETAEANEMEAKRYAKEAKARVLALIQMARTADQKILLMRHYIDGMTWEDAAEAAGKSRTWATNTHGEALLYISLPEPAKQK